MTRILYFVIDTLASKDSFVSMMDSIWYKTGYVIAGPDPQESSKAQRR